MCGPKEARDRNFTILKPEQSPGASEHRMEAISGFLNGNTVFGFSAD